jgi:hypothetical protein
MIFCDIGFSSLLCFLHPALGRQVDRRRGYAANPLLQRLGQRAVGEANPGIGPRLGACTERPHRCRTAQNCDEIAPFELIELHRCPCLQYRHL